MFGGSGQSGCPEELRRADSSCGGVLCLTVLMQLGGHGLCGGAALRAEEVGLNSPSVKDVEIFVGGQTAFCLHYHALFTGAAHLGKLQILEKLFIHRNTGKLC